MTIYELTQAIVRYKKALLIGFALLILMVVGMTFQIDDGAIGWRGGEKWESSFQISVVAPGTVSLNEPASGDNLNSAASAYGDLLSSGEAAEAIGILSGYELGETIDTTVSRDAPVISATVIGPSPAEAKSAAVNAFDWLAVKIEQPIDAQPPVSIEVPPAVVILDEPFSGSISAVLSDSLASVDEDLLIILDLGDGQEMVVAVADRAGSAVSAITTLVPNASIVMNLESAEGTRYDQLRLVSGPLPPAAEAYPSLEIQLGARAITSAVIEDEETEDTEVVWMFDSSHVATEWIPGTPPESTDVSTTEQFQIAMLTDNPTALQIGGRRGPLLGFTLMLVGSIALLAGVIIADTWRRDRDSVEIASVNLDGQAQRGGDAEIDVKIVNDDDRSGSGSAAAAARASGSKRTDPTDE